MLDWLRKLIGKKSEVVSSAATNKYYIDKYKDSVLAWKMPGAGGGGYLALVVTHAEQFCKEHPEAFPLRIRRE